MQNAKALRVAGDKVTCALQEHEIGCYEMKGLEFEALLSILRDPCFSRGYELDVKTDVSIDQLSNFRVNSAPGALHTMLNIQDQ